MIQKKKRKKRKRKQLEKKVATNFKIYGILNWEANHYNKHIA